MWNMRLRFWGKPRTRRWIRSGVLFGLALGFGFSAADTASAQQQALVSNLGQADFRSPSYIASGFGAIDNTQQFTTGSNPLGYKLNSVDIEFSRFDTGFTYTVKIHNNSNGKPGTVVGTLTKPTFSTFTTDKVLTFSASGSGLSLAANTSYFIVIDITGAIGTRIAGVRVTTSRSEDSGGAAGWSLADMHLFRLNIAGSTWTNNFVRSTLKIRINGSLILPTVTVASVASPISEGAAARFTVSRSGATTAALTVGLRVDEESASGQDYVDADDEGLKSFTIPAGSSSAVFSVSTEDDDIVGNDGEVTLTVAKDASYKVGDASSAAVAVNNNDVQMSLSVSNLRVSENGGSASYDLTVAGNRQHDVTVSASLNGVHSDAIELSQTTHSYLANATSGVTTSSVTVTMKDGADEPLLFRNRSVTVTYAATSDDLRYNGKSASLDVVVADASVVDAFEPFGYEARPGNEGVRRRHPTPMSAFWFLRRDTLVVDKMNYAIAVSNRPVGAPVTVTATVADFTKAGLSYTRNGVPQASLTFRFADAAPATDGCPSGRGPSNAAEGADGPWECWRRVWIVRKLPAEMSGCVEIEHTASGGGVRSTTTDQIGTVRAQLISSQWRPRLPMPCPTVELNTVELNTEPNTPDTEPNAPDVESQSSPAMSPPDTPALEAFTQATSVLPVAESTKEPLTIIDDDSAAGAAIWMRDRSARETRGRIRFNLRLNQPVPHPVRVCVKTRNTKPVSARAGRDYEPLRTQVRFRPGETLKRIYVNIHDDSRREGSETFELVLSCAHGASVADGLAVGTIKDND